MKPFIVRIAKSEDRTDDWELDRGALQLLYNRFSGQLWHDKVTAFKIITAYIEKHGRCVNALGDSADDVTILLVQANASVNGAGSILLHTKEYLDKWKREADASLEAAQEKPHRPAHQKYYGYTGHLWQNKPVWARRMELLRAECNESDEPFNQRIEVMHQMCIDLAIQAEIDFDAQATGCTLKQLIDHYGHAAGTAIFSMIYNEDD